MTDSARAECYFEQAGTWLDDDDDSEFVLSSMTNTKLSNVVVTKINKNLNFSLFVLFSLSPHWVLFGSFACNAISIPRNQELFGFHICK